VARLLLDTHAFLWAVSDPDRLGSEAREAIADRTNDVFVSAAAAWEIAIKQRGGKLALPMDAATFVPAAMTSLGAAQLDISFQHALATESLPEHHRDPFDRIMIAQAQVENMTFVTRDAFSLRYPVRTLSA
jgi:PIN domain nuclease of toxin-antitoxin system